MNLAQELQPSNASLLVKVLMAELQTRKDQNKLRAYRPYIKQAEFHGKGKTYRERLLMAGNQLGKTWSAGFETAMHLTGRYPDWWDGRTWDKAVNGWAAGVTGEVTRDSVQRILLGRFNAIGTGAIPKESIKEKSLKRGVADAVDTLVIRHGGGSDVQAGESLLGFKSYDQGRAKFQAETLDFVWLDEEPDEDIYTESLTRTNATGGIVYMTFTPLMGMTGVVKRFLIDKPTGTNVTSMTIEDAEHYTPEQRKAIIDSYPAHEREARTKGIPALGSGRIFPVTEESISVQAFPIPDHWARLGGLDFGWDHPSAAVDCVWDRDADEFYVVNIHRQKEQTPGMFSLSLKDWPTWLPYAWPHDGLQHDKGSGEQLAAQYRKAGLQMMPERATFPDGTNGVEAGLQEMLQRMQLKKFKVFSHLSDWFEEFRMYHRKDGKVVKESDDLMAATRYAYMMRRYGVSKKEAEMVYQIHQPEPDQDGIYF
jgi:phage terminase large subunit-like protein